MIITAFQAWKNEHPSFMTQGFIRSENKKWARLDCHWQERQGDKIVNHTYAALLNLENGDIYLDCRPRKIFAKCLAASAILPLHILVKTIYHIVLPVSIPYEIYKSVQAGREAGDSHQALAKRCLKNCARSLADIVRTPLYGIAQIIVLIAGIAMAPIAPKQLYNTRALLGRLQRAQARGEHYQGSMPCFEPIKNLTFFGTPHHYVHEDTIYSEGENAAVLQACSNYARSQILYRREHKSLFNDCYRLPDPHAAYTSQALSALR